jgi:hypothetical protein
VKRTYPAANKGKKVQVVRVPGRSLGRDRGSCPDPPVALIPLGVLLAAQRLIWPDDQRRPASAARQ